MIKVANKTARVKLPYHRNRTKKNCTRARDLIYIYVLKIFGDLYEDYI